MQNANAVRYDLLMAGDDRGGAGAAALSRGAEVRDPGRVSVGSEGLRRPPAVRHPGGRRGARPPRRQLAKWDCKPGARDDLLLAVSELVTTAVVHGAEPIRVTMVRAPRWSGSR